ncbi:hypothetical protein HDU76_013549 [Blyttiomyces sp. JEL0837]|nr:hypothetical protein HDU76_013549 [Blyttiomyces sp. JEL0837]
MNHQESSESIEMHEDTAFSPNGPNKFKKAGAAVGKGLAKTGTAVFSERDDFRKFNNLGNVVDLAVGVVIGAAFTAIVNSFVNDLITPFLGLIAAKNLENTFIVLRCPTNTTTQLAKDCHVGSNHSYTTITQAGTDGAVTWNYGRFIQTCINFLLIAIFVFFIVKIYAAAFLRFQKKEAPKTKACPECAEDVKISAHVCKFCKHQFPAEEPSAAPAAGSSHPSVFNNFQVPFIKGQKKN